jgi:hypothetical protein
MDANTNENMNTNFEFTRYLYEKEEVKIALQTSILDKKVEEALFWAYELFYSGFTCELYELFWNIYYDFYATMNPSFEKYLLNNLSSSSNLDEKGEKVLALVVNNFIIRPHTTDVFILQQIVKQNEFEYCKQDNEELLNLLASEDYLMIAYFILNASEESYLPEIYISMIEYFENLGLNIDIEKEADNFEKMKKNNFLINYKRIILLSRMIHYFVLLKKIKLGKNLFITLDEDEINNYKTINLIEPAWKTLSGVKLLNIDKNNYLSLFHLKREKYNIINAYRENWCYHASFSPLWDERINSFNGIIDHVNQKIIFNHDYDNDADDNLERFYQNYGFEPDEQKIEIQEKTIQNIKNERTCLQFYKKHKNHGIVDIEEEYLNEMYKFE